jgi:cytochrome bd-type quinol oxidase subunit 2
VDLEGWSVALGVGGLLAGGAVGGIVGSFAGLPSTPPDPDDVAHAPDPFDRKVLPFLIPPFLVLVIAAIIVTFGSALLQMGKSATHLGPIEVTNAVLAALVGIIVIGVGGAIVSAREPSAHPSRSSRETVSHSDH